MDVPVVKVDNSGEFPDWFKPEPGFKFRDYLGNPCQIVGWGGWQEAVQISKDTPFGKLTGVELKKRPCALLHVFFYNDEWHLRHLKPSKLWDAVPGWTEYQEKKFSGWV